jgi:hypothetical protein
METKNKDVLCMEVASVIVECIAEKYGEKFQDPAVLEGIYLSMQMIGGPRQAARVINECAIKAS